MTPWGERPARFAVVAALVCAAAALALAGPDAADAQCAMCKTAVRAGGEQSWRTMRTAMLVLLIPPVTIFCSIFIVAYRSRSRAASGADRGEERDGRR